MPESSVSAHARRSPTAAELAAWRGFVETSERMRSAVGTRMQADSGLSSGDYSVLLRLAESPGQRLRSSELAARVGWERSRLSQHLGRMEQRSLVRRENCATDNRGAEVILTPEGASVFRRAGTPHLHAIRDLFVDALTPDQLEAVAGITAALSRHLDDVSASS